MHIGRARAAGRRMRSAARPRTITDYDEVFGPVRERRQEMSGSQLGDPARAGAAIVEIATHPESPTHLILGSDAVRLVAQARAEFDAESARWVELSRSTDFPDGAEIA